MYQELNKINLVDDINEKFNNEKNNFKKEIIEIKINSIKFDLNKKKYMHKRTINNFNLYYYENKNLKIYWKENNDITNLITLLKKFKIDEVILITNKKNKHIILKNIFELNIPSKNSYILIENIEYEKFKSM